MIRAFLAVFCHMLLLSSMQGKDYNILDFGAVGDAITMNTSYIQSAIDAATRDGGGRVIIPSGVFLSGSIVLKTGVELHLLNNAVLLGASDPAYYFKLNRWMALILADNQENISITGDGLIDGQGRRLALHIDSLFYAGKLDSANYNFTDKRPSHFVRPQLLEFVRCKNILIKNVTLKNASCWVQTYDQCYKVVIDHVRTESVAYWNNDGMDIQDCRNVIITNCFVNSADDGICLKSQSPDFMCDSIYISDCTIRSSASAVKFGTVSHGGFKNIVIDNIKIYDTYRSAVAIECVDGGTIDSIFISNIHADNTGNAIFIRLGKRNTAGVVGTLKNVTLKNFKVKIAAGRPDAGYEYQGPDLSFKHDIFPSSISGIPGYNIDNIALENIKIKFPGGGKTFPVNLSEADLDAIPEKISDYPEFSMFGNLPAWGFYVKHVNKIALKNIRLTLASPDTRTSIVFDDVREGDIHKLKIHGDKKPYIFNNIPTSGQR